jgi:hypothetical protein
MSNQILAARQTKDTLIMQKVNAVNREAFTSKYPGQVEHCLRLTMERLQAGLDKRNGVDVADPLTWRMSSIELQELAHAAYLLNEIRLSFPSTKEI